MAAALAPGDISASMMRPASRYPVHLVVRSRPMEVLTAPQLEEFRTKGFLHLVQFIVHGDVAALQRETEDLHEQMASLAVAEGQTGHNARLKNGAHVSWAGA